MSRLTGFIAAAFFASSILLLLTRPDVLTPTALHAAALGLFCLGLWASGIVPEFLASIIFFLFAMLFAVAPAEVIFSGFYSAALWMVFGGLVLAVAVKMTGLGERIARFLAPKFGATYLGIITGVVVISVALAFVMPATMGRVMLLAPIILALAGRFGFGEGSRGRTGMALALGFGTFIPPFAIMPANVPNLILIGAAETLYGVVPAYGNYFLLHFPVLGLLKAGAIILMIAVVFSDTPGQVEPEAQTKPDFEEKKLGIILMIALALWMTDFAHHVSPAWVALGVAVLVMLPGIGVVTTKAFTEKVNLTPMFYVAGVMGLGAMVSESGLGALLGTFLIDFADLRPGQDAWTFGVMAVLGAVIGPFVTNPGMPAVLAPLAGEIAQAAGLPVSTILMMMVVSISMVTLPFQAAPLVIAAQILGVKMADSLKACMILMVITLTVLVPLDYYWWRLLGVLN